MKTIKLLIVVFFYTTYFYSQDSIIELSKLKEPINFDGKIDEILWLNALKLSDFKQLEPNLGVKANEKPVVFITYDKTFLYVGANIIYNNPSKLFATALERDTPTTRDDFIEIHIDSYNDHTNSLVFSTNALGARYDYEVSRNGQEINSSWNTFWDVKTARNKNGWSLEMRIPFTSLRYNQKEFNAMRIKAVVKYKHNNELIISPLKNIDRQPVVFQFRNTHEVVFKELPKSNPIFITPYVKAGIISKNDLNEKGDAYKNNTQILGGNGIFKNQILDKIASNIGLDIKYKPTSNQTLDITLNTDFAQAEADDRIINNTRFPIFFPEKRLFFLENADLFNSNQFNHRLFHSRRIGIENGKTVPIIGGLRYVGNKENFQFGFLSMQTNKMKGILPAQNMSVLRLKKKVGSLGSYIGFLGTSKLSKEDFNYLFAMDGSIRLKQNLLTQFTLASTFDKFTGKWKYTYGGLISTFKSNGFGVEYRFRDYQEGFNPELGFVSRPNTKRLTLNHGWRTNYKNHSFLQRFSIGNWLTKYWISSNGKPEFFQTNIYLFATFKSGYSFGMYGPILQKDNLFSVWDFSDEIKIPKGNYQMWKVQPFFSTGNAYIYRLRAELEFGEFYGGKQTSISGTFNYDYNKNFQLEVGAKINRFKFPDIYSLNDFNRVNTDVWFSKFKFSFSSSSFLNTFIQYDSKAKNIGWNFRYRYVPNEGTNLYIVYNQSVSSSRSRFSPRLPVTNIAGFTIKFSKTFL